jgi:hypothetical protein
VKNAKKAQDIFLKRQHFDLIFNNYFQSKVCQNSGLGLQT